MPDPRRPFSPVPNREEQSVEQQRLNRYRLNVPDDDAEVRRQQLNRDSPFYAAKTVEDIRPEQLLPYRTESIREQYRYLCHIVTHIYIAIKSLDLKGNISIGVADLDKARSAMMSEQSVEDFMKAQRETPEAEQEEGERFETLAHTESEADEDDEEEDDEDSWYESDYSSDEDENMFASTPVSKVGNKSASVISLKYWTKELKNLLTIGLVMPGTLSASLVRVFYAVILSRGQSIDIGFYTDVVVALIKEKEVLREVGLKLPWEPIYEELAAEMTSPNASSHMTDDLRFKRIVRFSLAINGFFDEECIPLVMEKIMTKYTNQTISSSFIQIAVMLPLVFKKPTIAADGSITYDKRDIRHYLPIFFSCWTTQRSNKEIACLLSIIANIGEAALSEGSKHPNRVVMGVYGIFTKEQFGMFVNQLVVTTRVTLDEKQSKYVKLLVDLVVHSLTSKYAFEKEGVMDLLRTFANSIRTLVHPSNSGTWSTILSRVIKRFATTYHRRLLQERSDRSLVAKYSDDFSGLKKDYRLSEEVTTEFVKTMTPLLLLGVQSKSSGQRRRYVTALQTLCFVAPTQILDSVLLDIYSSFDSVNSTHRISVVLRELNALVRYMAQLPVYRVHIPRLLSMLVPGVDSNDPQKTILTISLVKLVATVVPFVDLTEGMGDGGMLAMDFTSQHLSYLEAKFYESSPKRQDFIMDSGELPDHFVYDKEFELEALKSATSSFPEFIRQFCDGCFKYLEYSPNVEGDDGIETRASVLIAYAMDSLMESLNDDMFTIVADKFYEYITNNVKHLVALVFSNIAELIIRRDPKTQLPRFYNFLISQIRAEMSEGAGTSRAQEVLGKDARLIWYLKLLCGTCLGAGKYLVPYLPDLQHFITQETSELKGEASYSISLLVNSIFGSVSCTRPVERRLISQDWLNRHNGKVTEACWGGFQFDPYRMNPSNLQFEWYRPSANEVDPLVNSFEAICDNSLQTLEDFLQEFDPKEKIPLEVSDELSYHINILDGSVSGICTLFDPAFRPHMLEPAKVLSSRSNSLTPGMSSGGSGLSASASSVSLVSMAPSSSYDGFNSRLTSPIPGVNLSGTASTSGKYHPEEQHADDAADLLDAKFEARIERDGSEEPEGPAVDDYVIPESEMPSGMATPSLMGGGGEFESIDASLTDRSSMLYTFGYYFDGNTFTKLSDPSHVKLHTVRERIGHVLHDLAGALLNHDGAIELISHVIQTISGWLKNCGYFSSNNPVFIDNIHFVSILDCQGVNNPYTRVIFGARAAIYHCNRMNISRCTRLPTDTDKLLIRDLVSLSASSYRVTSYHASSVLTSALSKIMNCTYLVFGIFKEWDSALANKDEEKLKNILRLFSLRKFRGLAEKNSHFLKKYEDLLVRSIEVDEYHITSLSLKLYGSIKKYVRIPCKVCLIDFDLVESIRPPDADIDRRIRTLKLAKETKKKTYFNLISKLASRTIHRTSKHLYWKLFLKALELIASLHTHFEIPLNPEVLKVLAKSVNGIHPLISKKCVIWMASILDVVTTKGLYNYDLDRILCVNPSEPQLTRLSSVLDVPDADHFFSEMKNFKNPSFFIDSKYWVPTLAWNKDMKVMDGSYKSKTLGFNRQDEKSVRRFGTYITKKWVLDILNLHIEESESNTAFLPGMAYFISSVANLALHGYTENFKYEDFFDIVDEIYKKDEKSTHLATTEIYTGLLISCRTEPSKLVETDRRIAAKLTTVFQSEITQSTLNIWKIFCWWVPAHFDMRRCPRIVDVICDFSIDSTGNGSPFNTFARVTLLKAYISSALNRYHNFDGVIQRLFLALAHPYHIVAEKVASTLFDCLLYTSTKSFGSFEEFMVANSAPRDGLGIYPYDLSKVFGDNLLGYLNKIKELRVGVDGLSPQALAESDYMYAVRGLQFLIMYVLKTSHGDLLFPYLEDYIVPLLFDLDNMKDACKLISINSLVPLYLIASIRYTKPETEKIVNFLCSNAGLKNPSLTQTTQLVSFNQAYYLVRFLTITKEQRAKLVALCASFLYNKHLDVREQAASFFTIVVHSYVASDSDDLIQKCIKRFGQILSSYKKVKGRKVTSEEVATLHGATLGLGALVEAFPYTTPPPKWLPRVLSLLANECSAIDGLVGRTAKDVLSKFKKTRQDTWHIDSKFFTQEQLEDLEGVLWKSYFI
ncbi:DEKNAAC104326 [Brettanomyces naardenensis]|uniref:DEKNAAC104326 n=1 Tax=Brettanomyces naardenensis TaxID=13370 RepID=A0A448YQR2_BRENA|nr:DEKNAAC104326 [Brettanomyces naardenensis]